MLERAAAPTVCDGRHGTLVVRRGLLPGAQPVTIFFDVNHTDVEEALEIARRAHRWLRWMEGEARTQRLSVPQLHHALDEVGALEQLVRAFWNRTPTQARPREHDIARFVRHVASYLSSSLDFDDKHRVVEARRDHFDCMVSAQFQALPHARPKRLRPVDKERADGLERAVLVRMANEAGAQLAEERVQRLLDAPQLREARAVCAYIDLLLARQRGEAAGPEVLVLWRRFAWTTTGAPRQDFELTVELYDQSLEQLRAALSQ
jgi:hypothetical protein